MTVDELVYVAEGLNRIAHYGNMSLEDVKVISYALHLLYAHYNGDGVPHQVSAGIIREGNVIYLNRKTDENQTD